MKCGICGSKIETTFLEKVVGAYVKDKKGKKHLVCPECQKSSPSKAALLEKLK